jgi:hypothetical protein
MEFANSLHRPISLVPRGKIAYGCAHAYLLTLSGIPGPAAPRYTIHVRHLRIDGEDETY